MSCRPREFKVNPPLFLLEILYNNWDLSKWQVLVHIFDNTCLHGRCVCLVLQLSSSTLQPCDSGFGGNLFPSLRKEPYAFQHCSIVSADFIVQVTHQPLGSFQCEMWWKVINFYTWFFIYSNRDFVSKISENHLVCWAVRELKYMVQTKEKHFHSCRGRCHQTIIYSVESLHHPYRWKYAQEDQS